jgi:hypothetical protein
VLKLPALPVDAAAMVFGDDQDPRVFYAVPAVPHLRRSPDGSAALSFLVYRTGVDSSGSGGLLEFQTELTFTEADRARILAALQQRSGGPVQLREPTYVDGAVRLLTFAAADGAFVESVEGSEHPALSGGCAAAFSLTLSATGATFMDQALRSTPTPVAVRYTLSFLAKLPAGRVHVWLRSGPLRERWATELAGLDPLARRDALCNGDVAGVEILDWPAGEPSMDELKQQLVEWGWGTLEQATAGALAQRTSGASPDLSRLTDVDVVLTGTSVITWTVHPQANLTGFDPSRFQRLDLSEAIFQRLEVEARCNADFAGDRIHSVLLRLRYGDHHQETLLTDTGTTATFTAVVDPALGRTYAYDAVVRFAGTDKQVQLPERTSDARHLMVDVGDVGWLRIDIAGSPVEWDQVALVEVGISYADEGHGVEPRDDVVVLRSDAHSVRYERAIWAPVTRPWRYRRTYVRTDGTKVELPWQESSGRTLVVAPLHDRVLAVRLVAGGVTASSDDPVAGVLVECTHTSADGGSAEETFALSPGADAATWTVPLLPADSETFRYRATTTYRDGSNDQTGWTEATGSQTVVVGDPPAELMKVDVLADLVDFSQVKLVRVSLRHTSTGREEQTADLVFSAANAAQRSWTVPLWKGGGRRYTWSARFYLADSSRRSIPPADTDDLVLVLQLPAS